MIDVHLLRYALAAADTGSFSRAAMTFGIKQTTLSKRVRYLELRLGLALFARSTQGVIPTDSGQRFLNRARRILCEIDALTTESVALAKGETGTLRLGFCGSLVCGDLAATLQAYRRQFPGVEIDAREAGRSVLLDRLEAGALDLAVFAGQAATPEISSACFWREPLTIALPSDHPAAVRTPMYWADLRGAGFIVTGSDSGADVRAIIVARLSRPGYTPSITTQKVSRENLLSLIAADRIAAFSGSLPPTTGTSITLRTVHDAFGATALEQGVHWRSTSRNPAVRCFLDLLSVRYGQPPLP